MKSVTSIKKFLLFAGILVICAGYAKSEVVYLKDGQVLKGVILEQNSSSVKLKVESNELNVNKADIKNISFSNEIKNGSENNADDEQSFSKEDREMKEVISEFKYEYTKKKDKRLARGRSVLSLGTGFGLPYGFLGYRAEVLFGGHFGVGLGLDSLGTGMKNIGVIFYPGDQEESFRWRFGLLFGDTGVAIHSHFGQDSYTTVSGKFLFTGFQWKMATWLSLNLDLGYVMHNEHEVVYSYTSYSYYGYSRYTETYEFSDGFAPALGFMFHF